MGIDVIVAPYEADAQLAYLNTTQIADYVITEDSDLVLFGCHHVRFDERDLSCLHRSLRSRFSLNSMKMVMANCSIDRNSI